MIDTIQIQCICIPTSLCQVTHTHTHTHTHMHAYIHTYIHTHTHTHIATLTTTCVQASYREDLHRAFPDETDAINGYFEAMAEQQVRTLLS